MALVVIVTACTGPPPASPTPRPSQRPVPSISAASATTIPTGPPSSSSPTVRPTASPSAEAGGVYLALGDSITFGIGVRQPQRNGYVARVADALRGGEPPITDTRVFAVPGETATGFRDRRLDDVVTAIETLGPRVRLVTIGLGANELLRAQRDPACAADRASDACRAVIDVASSTAADALTTIVAAVQAALRAEGAAPTTLLLAYYNPDTTELAAQAVAGADGRVGCSGSEAAPGLDDRIACVAAERGVGLVDLHAAFLGREAELTRIRGGDVHPNGDGYAVIAESILSALTAADR